MVATSNQLPAARNEAGSWRLEAAVGWWPLATTAFSDVRKRSRRVFGLSSQSLFYIRAYPVVQSRAAKSSIQRYLGL